MYIAHITLLSLSSQCYAMQSFLTTQLPKSECTQQAHHALVKCGTGSREVTQGCHKWAHSEHEMYVHTDGGPHTLEVGENDIPAPQDNLWLSPSDQQGYRWSETPEVLPPPASPHQVHKDDQGHGGSEIPGIPPPPASPHQVHEDEQGCRWPGSPEAHPSPSSPQ
ncbi:hypothetical protein BKA82DRAFT_4018733 [Pisolithus tinctorius]|nr:hypothetical protein BKA82DRAFT_4018733 [Pisolithus tinctorius]